MSVYVSKFIKLYTKTCIFYCMYLNFFKCNCYQRQELVGFKQENM